MPVWPEYEVLGACYETLASNLKKITGTAIDSTCGAWFTLFCVTVCGVWLLRLYSFILPLNRSLDCMNRTVLP